MIIKTGLKASNNNSNFVVSQQDQMNLTFNSSAVQPPPLRQLYLGIICIIPKPFCIGSGCGSVGRADAFYSKDLRFESSHQQNFILNIFNVNCRIDDNKEKRGRDWTIFIKKNFYAGFWGNLMSLPKSNYRSSTQVVQLQVIYITSY